MNLKWKEAIEKVLSEENRPLHYTEIAELIAQRGYRTSLGATPQDSVSSNMTTDINTNGENSIFQKGDTRGYYKLKSNVVTNPIIINNEDEITEETYKTISSFGIYWDRAKVDWQPTTPNLLGVQLVGASEVNFKDQIGIYLLHDFQETVYVGQAIKQPLGIRLKDHTKDRLNGRWNRFSWFGFFPVKDDSSLETNISQHHITLKNLGDILEAVLIESIVPRQNRKQGNFFNGLEYLQQEAPEIKKKQKEQILKELLDKI